MEHSGIVQYIAGKYAPLCIIMYGSYADGSYGPDSDFDALAVTPGGEAVHDTGTVDGVRLDLFVYPASHFDGGPDWEEVVQIYHGRVLSDTGGIGERLIDSVRKYVDAQPLKTREEVKADISWCGKMLLRARRGDPEGMFRWHWLLTDSLEMYCAAEGQRYWGPKKTLLWMERERPQAFLLYTEALASMDYAALERWIDHIRTLTE